MLEALQSLERLGISSNEISARSRPSEIGASCAQAGASTSASADLQTEDITLISHTHGRERRAERSITKPELQAAVKHGRREQANPSPTGQKRIKFTHKGVCYITDATGRHEITSWRLDESEPAVVAGEHDEAVGYTTHAVLIVDNSGSMRQGDVTGFDTRTEAVYECLARDFVEPQLQSGGGGGTCVVTLIEMSDTAKVVLQRRPLDAALAACMRERGRLRARNHGNFLPALDCALDVLQADESNGARLLLLFLSDGAPSDQQDMACAHGVQVWNVDRKADPKLGHTSKGAGWYCRQRVLERVGRECVERVEKLGDLFGRDRTIISTVAFGSAQEDFATLQKMSEALPRNSFQKLGLNAAQLHTAFTSLTSSLTTLRTEGGSQLSLESRGKQVVKHLAKRDDVNQMLSEKDGWYLYSAAEDDWGEPQRCLAKYVWHTQSRSMMPVPFSKGADGLAFFETPFAEGREKYAYKCTEIRGLNTTRDGSCYSERVGTLLVGKESSSKDRLGLKFLKDALRIQSEASQLARRFNDRLRRSAAFDVTFAKCALYECRDETYPEGVAWVLAEEELVGKYTKWNNNAGGVLPQERDPVALGAIQEEDEDSSDEEWGGVGRPVVSEVPQAFSHFTFEDTDRKKLVCDMQGVWNSTDGYVLTDPVVHYVSKSGRRHLNGATDKGHDGVVKFFETHKCGALCRQLGLSAPKLLRV